MGQKKGHVGGLSLLFTKEPGEKPSEQGVNQQQTQ